MDLTFPKSALSRLVDATEAALRHHVPYTGSEWGIPKECTPGLVLAGDNGVYFMSNRAEPDNHIDIENGGSLQNVVYANECSPCTPDWIEIKRLSFGGKEGIVFFPLAKIKRLLNTPRSVVTMRCTSAAVILKG